MHNVPYLGDRIVFPSIERYHVEPTHPLDRGDRQRTRTVEATITWIGETSVGAVDGRGREYSVPWYWVNKTDYV